MTEEKKQVRYLIWRRAGARWRLVGHWWEATAPAAERGLPQISPRGRPPHLLPFLSPFHLPTCSHFQINTVTVFVVIFQARSSPCYLRNTSLTAQQPRTVDSSWAVVSLCGGDCLRHAALDLAIGLIAFGTHSVLCDMLYSAI